MHRRLSLSSPDLALYSIQELRSRPPVTRLELLVKLRLGPTSSGALTMPSAAEERWWVMMWPVWQIPDSFNRGLILDLAPSSTESTTTTPTMMKPRTRSTKARSPAHSTHSAHTHRWSHGYQRWTHWPDWPWAHHHSAAGWTVHPRSPRHAEAHFGECFVG